MLSNVLVFYFLQTLIRCVEIKVFNFEVKAKERLVGSVEIQSECHFGRQTFPVWPGL